jgi:hypothetical protein
VLLRRKWRLKRALTAIAHEQNKSGKDREKVRPVQLVQKSMPNKSNRK